MENSLDNSQYSKKHPDLSQRNTVDKKIEEIIKLVKNEKDENNNFFDEQFSLRITAKLSQDSLLSQYLQDY